MMTEERRQAVAEHLQELYEEESWEAGSRLARAAKAREDGYPEVAAVMEEIACDEARHLSLVVRLLRPEEVERNVQANLEAALFEALARDELEHVAELEAALKQLNAQTEGEERHVKKVS